MDKTYDFTNFFSKYNKYNKNAQNTYADIMKIVITLSKVTFKT